MGCITPLGIGRELTWDALTASNGGIDAISRFDASDYPSKIAGEVKDFDPVQYLDRKEARKTDRFIQFALAASIEALDHAGFAITDDNADRVGVIVGSAIGGLATFERGVRTLQERGPRRVSPFFIPMTLVDMAAGYVSIQLGARGPNLATVSACSTGAHAIGEAAATIKRGAADVMLAGASEAPVEPSGVAGFAAAGALSTRNDDPTHASRPFDVERDGFVIAEGAGILVLESRKHAVARGATPLATVSGYATTADASHIVQPAEHGAGAARAMSLAIETAGLSTRDIDYVNAHGTSTPLNDKNETLALKTVFQSNVPLVSSTKGATGHLLGAAPAIEAVFAVQSLQCQLIPPTINYQFEDPDCDLDYVPNVKRSHKISHVLSNSFGFGGHNAVLVFSRP